MPHNATSPGEVERSLGAMRIAAPVLTVVYEEEGPNGEEKHYASVPTSTNYQAVLNDARQCFEEVLPIDLDHYKLELKHELHKGCWASIHPRVFADLVTRSQIGELMLSARLARTRGTRGAQNNNAAFDRPATEPPPYAAAVSPVQDRVPARVIDTPALPIVNAEHAAICDRCDKEISGVRYRCTVCDDFDYCGICITVAPLEHGHRFDAIINATTKVYRPVDEWRVTGASPPPNVYQGDKSWDVRCDICGMYPLVGTRYKCAECPDWDACQNCLEKASKHHPNHTFVRATDSSVIMKRRVGPDPRHLRTGYQCSRCSTEIFGSILYRCNDTSCRILWVCDTCEALPFSRRQLGLCQHYLTKVYL